MATITETSTVKDGLSNIVLSFEDLYPKDDEWICFKLELNIGSKTIYSASNTISITDYNNIIDSFSKVSINGFEVQTLEQLFKFKVYIDESFRVILKCSLNTRINDGPLFDGSNLSLSFETTLDDLKNFARDLKL